MELNYRDKIVTIPDSIGDLTLGKFLNITERFSRFKTEADYKTIEGQIAMMEVVEMITNVKDGDLDDLTIMESTDLYTKVFQTFDQNKLNINPVDHFTIDDTTYATRSMQSLTGISTGENISIQTIMENELVYEKRISKMLAVLIRPATKTIDSETKEERWVQDRFDKKDIDNLDYRANLFLEKAIAKDVMPTINFFLLSLTNSTTTTKTSSEAEPL
jgi:hypothetical protein